MIVWTPTIFCFVLGLFIALLCLGFVWFCFGVFLRSPAISLGFTTFGWDFCVCDRFWIQSLRQSHSVFVDGACWVCFLLPAFNRLGHVRIFWVRAMKCMCAQTRPRFILSSERAFGGIEFEPMLTPREESPLPVNFPRGGSNLRRCGQRAQTLLTSYSSPLAAFECLICMRFLFLYLHLFSAAEHVSHGKAL